MATKAERQTAKERAIELAGLYWPNRLIAEELGVSRSTVQRYLAAYRAELPTPGKLRQERMHIALSEAHGIDDVLRVMSVARFFEERDREIGAGIALPTLTTVGGRQAAVGIIADGVGNGRISPAQAQAMLACVKEASDLDALSDELLRIDALEAQILNGGPIPAEYSPPNEPRPAA